VSVSRPNVRETRRGVQTPVMPIVAIGKEGLPAGGASVWPSGVVCRSGAGRSSQQRSARSRRAPSAPTERASEGVCVLTQQTLRRAPRAADRGSLGFTRASCARLDRDADRSTRRATLTRRSRPPLAGSR
jgi:hypothetical protein